MSHELAKDGLRVSLAIAPRAARVVAGSADEFAASARGAELESAYARGLEDGKRLAIEEGAGLLASAGERIEAACQRLVPELSVAAVDLAVEIAREIVRAEVDQHRHD